MGRAVGTDLRAPGCRRMVTGSFGSTRVVNVVVALAAAPARKHLGAANALDRVAERWR